MKKSYTVTEARHLLGGVDNKTFARWLARAGITLEPGKYDERQKRITHEDLVRLATQHERTLGALPPEREASPSMKALTLRQEELEQRIDALAEQVAQLDAALRIMAEQLAQLTAPAPRQHIRVLERTSTATVPNDAGLVAAVPFAEAHGIGKDAAKSAFKRQYIHTTKVQGDTAHYLDEPQRRDALAYWHGHSTPGYAPCSDPLCVCQEH